MELGTKHTLAALEMLEDKGLCVCGSGVPGAD